MLKTYLYVPDDLHDQILVLMQTTSRNKATVIREALEEGIAVLAHKHGNPPTSLQEIIQLGKDHQLQGLPDMSAHHDEYLWEGKI